MLRKTRRGLDAMLNQHSSEDTDQGRREDTRSESPAPVMRLAIEAIQVSCG